MLYPTRNHPSFFHQQKIVYPVVSRRSRGVSIGINLSPSKRCNFGCIYCQVQVDRVRDRAVLEQVSPEIDLTRLEEELRATIRTVQSGALFEEERFRETPADKRHLMDFAFSGDGEPTLSPQFAEAAAVCARVRAEMVPASVKMVLITNGTTLQNPETIRGCDILAENNGEIWGKLDGGTEADYRTMNRSAVSFPKILENLKSAASRWPMTIQTMLLRRGGTLPAAESIDRYCERVREITSGEHKVRAIQLYTVARIPVESGCSALADEEMDVWAARISEKTSLKTEVFYSK